MSSQRIGSGVGGATEQQLAQAKEASSGTVPDDRRSSRQPCSRCPEGSRSTGSGTARCEVRELTGVDEEALAKVRKPEETFDMMLVARRRADRGTRPVADGSRDGAAGVVGQAPHRGAGTAVPGYRQSHVWRRACVHGDVPGLRAGAEPHGQALRGLQAQGDPERSEERSFSLHHLQGRRSPTGWRRAQTRTRCCARTGRRSPR